MAGFTAFFIGLFFATYAATTNIVRDEWAPPIVSDYHFRHHARLYHIFLPILSLAIFDFFRRRLFTSALFHRRHFRYAHACRQSVIVTADVKIDMPLMPTPLFTSHFHFAMRLRQDRGGRRSGCSQHVIGVVTCRHYESYAATHVAVSCDGRLFSSHADEWRLMPPQREIASADSRVRR